MYAYVNWFVKSNLNFYNNEKDLPKKPIIPRRLRKLIYETQEQHIARVMQWEAEKPPPVNIKAKGNHMTKVYYTKHVLPYYIEAIQKARLEDSSRSWRLQEDNDPSYSTRSRMNVAAELKNSLWVNLLVHPAQSPDLNPIKGIWLILKQRTKRRLRYPTEGEEQWDGTARYLKQILYREWDQITIQEVRNLISEKWLAMGSAYARRAGDITIANIYIQKLNTMSYFLIKNWRYYRISARHTKY